MSAATTSLKLDIAEQARLRVGAASLGITLDDTALARFAGYAELLECWRSTSNLISCRSSEELVERHFLDALACAWPAATARDVADLGSGAGLPGVPLAIVEPRRRTLLVEPRRRRASFLREVRRTLGIEGIEVLEMRAEDFEERGVDPVDVAVCRAVWRAGDVALAVAAPWIRGGGMLLALRSEGDPGVRGCGPLVMEQSPHYRIGAGRPRRLDVYRKAASCECST